MHYGSGGFTTDAATHVRFPCDVRYELSLYINHIFSRRLYLFPELFGHNVERVKLVR
jgi:hypothetical protein